MARERTNTIDGKASDLVKFVGLLLALQSGVIVIFIRENFKMNNNYLYLFIIFLIGVIFLTSSVIFGLKAYQIRTWSLVPEPMRLVNEYAKKNYPRRIILQRVGLASATAIKENETINADKVFFLKYGLYFLVFGIIFNVIFMMSILIIYMWGN